MLKGARGYNNAVYLLNDYCKTMYSNSSKGAVARSLNIEDIQDKMKVVDEETGKKAYESYTSLITKTTYGAEYSYSSNRWYPLQWKKDNGIIGESEPKNPSDSDIKEYATENDAIAEENDTLTVTQTFWASSEMQSNFISADTRDTSKSNSMYYELLCYNGNLGYWLASRYVGTDSSMYAEFGLRYVSYGGISGTWMFKGYKRVNEHGTLVRPIVSLKSDIINIDAGYDETTGWELK